MVRPYGGSKKRSLSFSLATPRANKRYRGAVVDYAANRRRRMRRLRARNWQSGGFLGIEKKFYDTYVTDGVLVTTAASAEFDPAANVSCLNAMAEGDGESNRDGKKILMKSVEVNGHVNTTLQADQADAVNAVTVRVWLVLDTQTNGAQMDSEKFLLDTAGVDSLSLRNLKYSSRFKTLACKTMVLAPSNSHGDGANTGSVAGSIRPFRFFKRLNIVTNFSNTSADIANIVDNSLHIIAVASAVAGAPKISYQARVRFIG